MSAWRRSGAAVRLLAVLCVMAGCAATQQQQQQPFVMSGTTTYRLLDLIALTVRSELQPIVSKIESRIDALQTQIAEQTVRLDHVAEMAASPVPRPRDCSDLPAGATTGVHVLWPESGFSLLPIQGFCDMDTAGGNWTVFQRRADIRPRQDFYLGWDAYKRGFGDLEKEFWWGLEHLNLLTSVQDRQYELRIDMESINGTKVYAVYQGFGISSEADGYRLRVSNYTGDAADSLSYNNNSKFSTGDRDQDDWSRSCAQERKGAWMVPRGAAAAT